MAEPDAVSLRQFAAMQGCHPSQAHRWKVAGRLVMVTGADGRELVHVARSVALIAESSSPEKGYIPPRRGLLHHATPAPPPAPVSIDAAAPLTTDSEPPGQQSRNATYNQARTAREVYDAKLAQLRYEQEVGRLVDADAVRAEFAKQIIVVRDQFLRLPDRLAPMLVGMVDMETIKRTIMGEVRTALTQFTEAA